MVKAYVENGEFKFKGTFDFGYIGLFKDDQIGICENCEEIRDEWESVIEMTENGDVSDDDIAEYLADRFNALEKKIQENIREINDQFLLHVFEDMEACGREFWECEALTVPDFDYSIYESDDSDEDFYRAPKEALDDGYASMHFGMGEPNDGSVPKDSFEEYLRKYKPQFNLDNFIKGIKPEHVNMSDDYISFQCSDIYNYALICGAYDELDQKDLSFTDWHNY